MVLDATGLLPHINAGVLTTKDFEALKTVSGKSLSVLRVAAVSPRICVHLRNGCPMFQKASLKILRCGSNCQSCSLEIQLGHSEIDLSEYTLLEIS